MADEAKPPSQPASVLVNGLPEYHAQSTSCCVLSISNEPLRTAAKPEIEPAVPNDQHEPQMP